MVSLNRNAVIKSVFSRANASADGYLNSLINPAVSIITARNSSPQFAYGFFQRSGKNLLHAPYVETLTLLLLKRCMRGSRLSISHQFTVGQR